MKKKEWNFKIGNDKQYVCLSDRLTRDRLAALLVPFMTRDKCSTWSAEDCSPDKSDVSSLSSRFSGTCKQICGHLG